MFQPAQIGGGMGICQSSELRAGKSGCARQPWHTSCQQDRRPCDQSFDAAARPICRAGRIKVEQRLPKPPDARLCASGKAGMLRSADHGFTVGAAASCSYSIPSRDGR